MIASSLSTHLLAFNFQVVFFNWDRSVKVRQEMRRKHLQEDRVNEVTSLYSLVPRILSQCHCIHCLLAVFATYSTKMRGFLRFGIFVKGTFIRNKLSIISDASENLKNPK